ncbi:MAG: NAD-glutamate dehydrogenase [Proteobacteria bacterium]|nr:NAD-glutamate dehydrogenase [Pseudomonadota bacterium]
MARRDQHVIDETLQAVLALIAERFPPAEAARLATFARCCFVDVVDEDIPEETAANMFGAVAALWQFARVRKPGKASIRAYNPALEEHGWHSTHTAIEIVNDDMPFLVDSVVAALNQMKLRVHLLIHPIVRVKRNEAHELTVIAEPGERPGDMAAESVLHVEVTQQPGAERLAEIEVRLAQVLSKVRAAVEDWPAMMAELEAAIAELDAGNAPVDQEDLTEGHAFLEWLRDNHFTFLGYREYTFDYREDGTYAHIVEGKALGVLREISEESRRRHKEPLPEHFATYLERPELFIISKAWTRSDVHRAVYMDYIGVRRFDADGWVVGERRFLGLLTSTAYSASPRAIPLLRRKVAAMIERSGFAPASHNAKALNHILDSLPRDEIFQLDLDTLEEFALGVLHLEHRQRIRLFMRRDSYGQFVSCLVYIPRDRFSTDLRNRMENVLQTALGGASVDVTTQVSDSPMARAHFIVHTPGGAATMLAPAEIERRLIAASRRWEDDLQDALIDHFGEARGNTLLHRWAEGIPVGYTEAFTAGLAVADIERMEAMPEDGIAMNLYRRIDAADGSLNFKIYHAGDPVPLSGIMPMLEHMGLVVIEETPFELVRADGTTVWIHDFRVNLEHATAVDVSALRGRFHDTFERVWSGEVEDDDFNALVLSGLTWRQVVILRAYARYMNQANVPFSQSYIQQTMTANAGVAALLVALFEARFDPARHEESQAAQAAVKAAIDEALDTVAVLDQDRILRGYINLIEATLRTNYYQDDAEGREKSYISFKLDSGMVDGLPEPRPWREIFVYSNRVEAIHLRGGPVARGGIRWSDRPDDFRTEVLGLVKAQMVKNAVIVPVGAKGGFVVKRPPAEGGREAIQAEGIACYRIFMSALLDITDNLVAGQIVPREGVVRYDGDDPYLVVAADKGTATFSDIANAVAISYGHWLGDAFASGGSAGYDHKAMAITARGAWEAVKRHFRELSKNIQAEDFTVVGIGDMSGDVFGNGMLLSPHIRLVGAFNHLHIFVDPEPDAASSFKERQRLFDLPRSTWADYDPGLISPGGGVFERSAKTIPLSPEIQKRFGLTREHVAPVELMRAMLKADVDLLWNGGIGTYVKASQESHAEVGDRANDALRVDGDELRAKAVGEGGNLGLTQQGRIEYALAGGRINTDAIDNSAGVDCSDHEVNIKILLGEVVSGGDMTVKQRDKLLVAMTDEVAALVLRDNYLQTQALSVLEDQGRQRTDDQIRFMVTLDKFGQLDRAIEDLPDDETLIEWRTKGRRFTRPELSVLLAYAKMDLYGALLASDLPDDPDLESDLMRYFPEALQKNFAEAIRDHRLRREIVATFTTNSMVNRAGITFVRRVAEESGFSMAEVARAYTVARDAFALRDIWHAIEALDNKVPAAQQTAMIGETIVLIERATLWFLHHRAQPMAIASTIEAFRPAVAELSQKLPSLVSRARRGAMERAANRFVKEGVPEATATAIARLRTLAAVCDVVDTAQQMGKDVTEVGTVFFDVGEELGSEWLRDMIARLQIDDRWDRLAQQALFEESFAQQRALTARVLAHDDSSPDKAVARWIEAHKPIVQRARAVMADMQGGGTVDLAMVSVASRALRVLTQ